VFDVEAEMLKGTFKLYPKLKVYADTRKNEEGSPFEYGYVLKAFPDEPIKLITKESDENNTNFFKSW
jgi:hypothetical protein